MYKLPPLNGLRTFEAAARCGSFVQAGQELGVSSAAVSLQVKSLEQHLDKKLFLRAGNRIFLTDAGEELYPKLVRAFDELSEATNITRDKRREKRLVISVLPSLSELWLLPRVIAFREKTGLSVDIRIDPDPVEFALDAIDLRISYGSSYYAGFREDELFTGVAVPICSPAFWKRYSDSKGILSNVPDCCFIHNSWGPSYSSEPNWSDWMKRARNTRYEFDHSGLIISDMSLAIAAAKNGAGVALAPYMLVQPDIEGGRLLQPSQLSVEMKKNYVCIYPNARATDPILLDFLNFAKSPI